MPDEPEILEVSTSRIITGTVRSLQQLALNPLDGSPTFSGPGFYLTKTRTVLVVPYMPLQASVDAGDDLKQFRAYVYLVPWEKTIFSKVAEMPTQHDGR